MFKHLKMANMLHLKHIKLTSKAPRRRCRSSCRVKHSQETHIMSMSDRL